MTYCMKFCFFIISETNMVSLNYRFLSVESVKMYFLCKVTKFPGCFCVAILSAMTVLPGFPFMAEQFVVLLIDKLLN